MVATGRGASGKTKSVSNGRALSQHRAMTILAMIGRDVHSGGSKYVWLFTGAHIAHFFRGDQEQVNISVSFIQARLETGEQCVLVSEAAGSLIVKDHSRDSSSGWNSCGTDLPPKVLGCVASSFETAMSGSR